MKPIDYFKLQAKNLFKDFETQTTQFDAEIGSDYYEYTPKYFDILALVLDYVDIDENNFTLMNAQHPTWDFLYSKRYAFPITF